MCIRDRYMGNKLDLENSRAVQTSEGQQLATTNNAIFKEVSAMTAENINTVFDEAAQHIIQDIVSGKLELNDDTPGIKKGSLYATQVKNFHLKSGKQNHDDEEEQSHVPARKNQSCC
eukprot:TRINITY_DN5005_c0_g1_i20.p2 TRINITY_DN5005_c0_g1~~TRINITY_DN5005_c0_g1_i20.p2  ORF type:complete len:117 (+),score=20.43 TRINITY_DN5005_c0_g1_i20:99-449(+)